MTVAETGGGCSNTNMCHRIGLTSDHAKISGKRKSITRMISFDRLKRKINDEYYCAFNSIYPLGIPAHTHLIYLNIHLTD